MDNLLEVGSITSSPQLQLLNRIMVSQNSYNKHLEAFDHISV